MPAEECTSAALDLSEPQFPQLGNWANNLHPTLVARAGSGQSPWHRVSICWIFNSYFSVRDDPSTGIGDGAGIRQGEQKVQRLAGENYSGNSQMVHNG